MIRSFLLRCLAILVALFAAAYILDTAFVSHKAATDKSAAFGSVQVYLATPTKASRLEIFTDQPESVPCVHALFPHFGDSPCWYLRRHTTQQVN